MRPSRIRSTLVLAARVAKDVLKGSSLASLRFLGRPRTLVQYVSECALVRDSLASAGPGPRRRHVHEVLGAPPAESIVLGSLGPGAENWLWASYTLDIVSLCMLCRLARPRLVFEIGTLRGYTAYHFALNTGDDARILTLDIAAGGAAPRASLPTTVLDERYIQRSRGVDRYAFDGSPAAAKITRLSGDSATFDFAPYRGCVDLFFIDGAHAYEYVARDTRSALECCHPGSIVAWHDFGRVGAEGVSRCVNEVARDREVWVVPGGSVAFTRV
jgi:predicted O-methyltransferase YrrM